MIQNAFIRIRGLRACGEKHYDSRTVRTTLQWIGRVRHAIPSTHTTRSTLSRLLHISETFVWQGKSWRTLDRYER